MRVLALTSAALLAANVGAYIPVARHASQGQLYRHVTPSRCRRGACMNMMLKDSESAAVDIQRKSSATGPVFSTTETFDESAALVDIPTTVTSRRDGLVALFNLAKRRLWTKADYLHLHAISGTVFMVVGALYVFAFLGDEMLRGGVWQRAEAGAVSWPALAILWTGVINCVTCLPMSKFQRTGGLDTKGAGFKGLGIGMTMLGVWMSYFFSGHYPSFLSAADPLVALSFLAVIIHGIWNSEVALTNELKEKGMLALEAAPYVGPGGVVESRTEIVLNHRVASYPNLLHLPVLYNIIAGGQEWAHRVSERFPMEPALLFHASFGIAVANSIVFLGATLKDRKLMTLRQWLLLQVVVLTPFVTTIVDCLSFGNAVSINPLQTYAGLMDLV